MVFEIKDLLYIIGIVASAIISFLGTRHNMKEYIRDKNDNLKDEINNLKLAHQELKSKDELQQLVIEQIGEQINKLIPNLVEAVKAKKK